MEISKLKAQGIQLKTKNASLVIDCFDANGKMSPEADKADFGLSSKPLIETQRLDVDKRVFSWPGEYEVKGVAIHARPTGEISDKQIKPLLFVIYLEQFKVCYLPILGNEIHSDLIEQIGDVDLLIFTVAGDEKILQSTIEEIEPKSIMPLRTAENPHAVETFLQKIGLQVTEESDKISFKSKSDFSNEKMQVYLLN